MRPVANISTVQHAKQVQVELLNARQTGRRFSERNVLVVLSESMLSGAPIDPDFQALANAIISKAIIKGRLPTKQGGRPKGSLVEGGLSYDAQAVAGEYFDLMDAGHKSDECFEELARKHKKDSRTIQRIVSEGRMWHGDSKPARDQKRKSDAFLEGYGQPREEQPAEDERDDRVELACMSEVDALAKLEALIDLCRT